MDNFSENENLQAIAIIGMAGRFPSADNVETFWTNLINGVESIQFFSDEELLQIGVSEELLKNPHYVKSGVILENIDLFDAKFFGFSPREAEIMDPQQRLLLECAYETFEHGGYAPSTFPGLVGVYLGTDISTYFLNNLLPQQELINTQGNLQLAYANSAVATQISYRLNLRGPSIDINTACSTSLVAIHLACRSLLGYECDMALAGGASVDAVPKKGYLYQQGGILSPDGHCRAFDAEGQGTVAGHGVGLILLKRLEDAQVDGDTIYAVIRGSAINNDGSSKVGYTAPSIQGQSEVIKQALLMADVDPNSINYIECHGTGTRLGDPIEIAALAEIFPYDSAKLDPCYIGSVKTNIGHLNSAAGIAGVIKTVQALRYKQIPPSLHFNIPNPKIEFQNTSLQVNAKLRPWKQVAGKSRRAGVSSFGIGGTNAHLILEEAFIRPVTSASHRDYHLLTLSAKTSNALLAQVNSLAAYLERNPEINLADIAYTLQVGRITYDARTMVVCHTHTEGIHLLQMQASVPPPAVFFEANKKPPSIVMLFPGQGAQYINMAFGLYKKEPSFFKILNQCIELLNPMLKEDLLTIIYPQLIDENLPEILKQTKLTQPILFAVEYALACLWQEWGIKPSGLFGHSMGEYVAACLAGVFTLEDALWLVVQRARLMSETERGMMLAVSLSEKETQPFLNEECSLAAVNAPSLCVLAGSIDAIVKIEAQLAQVNKATQRLPALHAFHSHLMAPIVDAYEALVRKVKLNPPRIPFLSSMTGDWISAEQVQNPSYWANQLRQTVRFSAGINRILETPNQILLEVGPGHTLQSFVKQCNIQSKAATVLGSCRHPNEQKDDLAYILNTVGQLWNANVVIDWQKLHRHEQRRRVALPAYPFERKRYWISPTQGNSDFERTITKLEDISSEPKYSNEVYRRPHLTNQYIAPRNTLEEGIEQMWSTLLGIQGIGVTDSFFDLGGHSLLATQFVSRIRDTHHIQLSLAIFFANPTIAAVAGEIAAHKTARIESDIRRQLKENEILPVSLAQKRLWFLDQLEGPNSTYNMPCVLRLRGQLNFQALKASLQAVMARHAVLRTRFEGNLKEPVQIIQSNCEINLPIQDVEFSAVEQLILQEASQPFDLRIAPLIRAKLLKLADKDHIFLITMHHIISDGWSLSVLINDISAFYKAEYYNLEPKLPKLPIQYADYSLWQREWLAGEELSRQLNYWRHQLADLPVLLKLPTDKPRPSASSYQGHSINFLISRDLAQAVTRLSRKENVTPFMILLAAFQVFMYRYSGQEDIVVGSPIANRTRREAEPLIGFFVNTLVLRAKIMPHQTFREFLQKVKKTSLEAYDHQDVPFDYLVEILQPERSLNYSPLCQVEFSFQNTPKGILQLPDLEIEIIPFDSTVAKFDLTLSLEETSAGIQGIWEYNTDIFATATIQRMMGHFINLITAITVEPGQKLINLNLLSEAERHFILFELNNSFSPYVLDRPTHVIFSEQVKRSPNAIAVSHHEEQLTYLELEKRSNQLASFLKKRGVDVEERVALFLDRGIDYLVAMLAVMKAGGAFVPLNPESPLIRNQEILQHSEPVCVLVASCHYQSLLNLHLDISIICLSDLLWDTFADAAIPNTVSMDNLAYLIYTSGSTGKSKGVMIEHRGMVNHILAKITDLKIDQNDVVAQIAVQTFDVSIWQFLCGLLVGGRIAILTGEEAWEPKSLMTRLIKEKVSIIESVPSHTNILLNEIALHPQVYHFDYLRCYVSNAEPMPVEQCKRWFTYNPNIPIINTYGTTECSDDTSHLHIHALSSFETGYIPTKGVLPNMQLYVLDEGLNPVPFGVAGEIFVGGAGVGRGYFCDNEQTRRAFIPNPFSKNPRDKLYATGDLARFYEDGTLKCLGRKDFQVKIRGLRVEISEVEAILRRHPQINEVLVVAWQDKQEMNHLVGYLIPNIHPAPAITEIQRYCSQYLAAYMIPAYFIFLDIWPLSPNGKIDRKQLPVPSDRNLHQEANYVPPETELELQFSELWAKTLDLDKVGIRDNFFQIGGHSLAAVELVSGMSQILGKDIPLRSLFETPTIESLLQNNESC